MLRFGANRTTRLWLRRHSRRGLEPCTLRWMRRARAPLCRRNKYRSNLLAMSVHSFSFRSLYPSAPARPYLFVELHNPHSDATVNVYALIDTGADECALPASFASLLGHHLEDGILKKIGTGNGPTVAYAHTSCISFEGFSTGEVLIDYMPISKHRCLEFEVF